MRHPFVALNTANAQDGALIEVPDGHDRRRLHPPALHRRRRRHLVASAQPDRGRAQRQVTVVETYIGHGNYFTNTVTEIVAGDGAVVDHYKLESESLEAFHVGTRADSPGALVERDVAHDRHRRRRSCATRRTSRSTGEGASLSLDGLFVLAGTQHVDNHTVIDHVAAALRQPSSCTRASSTRTRAASSTAASSSRPDAVKTNSRQDEQEPAALRDGHHRLEADAGDPQRRREVQPRLDDRPARRGGAVLPPRPRHRRGGGAQPARLRLRQRDRGPDEDRRRPRKGAAARCSRAMPERLPERRGGIAMSAQSTANGQRPSRYDVDARPQRLPHPRAARCAASRSSISTTPPRRRSRAR